MLRMKKRQKFERQLRRKDATEFSVILDRREKKLYSLQRSKKLEGSIENKDAVVVEERALLSETKRRDGWGRPPTSGEESKGCEGGS